MNPLIVFMLLVLGLPTLELYLLIQVGSVVGAFPAVLLVLFTAVVGALLVRHQGMGTLLRVREAMQRGEVPALQIMEGALLLLAGLLLLIPGFFTDLVGFVLLVPGLRRLLLARVVKRLRPQTDLATPGPTATTGAGRVIEGEFRREP